MTHTPVLHRGVRRRSVALLFLLVAVTVPVLLVPLTAHGATNQAQIDAAWNAGLAWLLTHQRADGSWRSVTGTEFAATASGLEALLKAGVRGYPLAGAMSWLGNAEAASVDSLARKSLALKKAGLDATPHLQLLVAWRNAQQAWGAYDRFATSFPDTPLALTAIRVAQFSYADTEYATALCAMLTAQKAGDATVRGSWSYIKSGANPPASAITSAILPTTRNLLEIEAITTAKGWPTRTCDSTGYTISTVMTDGIDWLLTQRRNADGGFGEGGVSTVLEAALVYEVLSALRPTDSRTGNALDYLIAHQDPDGGWAADALVTALVLRALPAHSAALLPDTDRDSIPDPVEPILGTNPTDPDSRWLANPGDGDLNLDGVVDAADVALAQQIAAGQLTPTPAHLRHGDVAPPDLPDGVIDVNDVVRIQRKALGLEGF